MNKLNVVSKNRNKGKNNPMYGRHHTKKSISKMSLSKKGKTPWNKGKTGLQTAWNKDLHNKKTRKQAENAHKSNIGRKASLKTRKLMSLKRKGIKFTKNHSRKISLALKGRKFSEKTISRMSKTKKKLLKSGDIILPWKGKSIYHEGCKNSNWQGGKSFEPYGFEFNKKLKLKIKQRDNFQCRECYYTFPSKELAVHHIDYNKKNNNINNLITLCRSCHSQTNFNRNNWVNYFKEKICQK